MKVRGSGAARLSWGTRRGVPREPAHSRGPATRPRAASRSRDPARRFQAPSTLPYTLKPPFLFIYTSTWPPVPEAVRLSVRPSGPIRRCCWLHMQVSSQPSFPIPTAGSRAGVPSLGVGCRCPPSSSRLACARLGLTGLGSGQGTPAGVPLLGRDSPQHLSPAPPRRPQAKACSVSLCCPSAQAGPSLGYTENVLTQTPTLSLAALGTLGGQEARQVPP